MEQAEDCDEIHTSIHPLHMYIHSYISSAEGAEVDEYKEEAEAPDSTHTHTHTYIYTYIHVHT
jgi:hypothetical protein